jgi:membrane protein DedA with SNARE-associated domain
MTDFVPSEELRYLLATYGYLAIFLFAAIEATGIPVPGESMLILASVYAGTTHHLEIGLVIAAAAAGAILGDNLGYLAGQYGGDRLLRRYGRYVRLDERRLRLGECLFERHGGKVVFFGRFIPVLRIWAAFLAGMNRMRWPDFLLFNALGGIVWATLIGLGGYYLGDAIHRLRGPVAITTCVLAVLIMIAFLVFVRRNEQRLEEEAEKALPGPLYTYPAKEDREQAARLQVHLQVSSQTKTCPTPPAQPQQETSDEKLKDRAKARQAITRKLEDVLIV